MRAVSSPVPPNSAHAHAAARVATGPAVAPTPWSSAVLLRGGREALIDHQGALYRLRLTASGKLILTK